MKCIELLDLKSDVLQNESSFSLGTPLKKFSIEEKRQNIAKYNKSHLEIKLQLNLIFVFIFKTSLDVKLFVG